ncbi:MAG: putative monovalent cation/H+ antiporter subunit A [candidate division KSB1 bacterium]|nr:putative monovalent cation/H+ antiporter subunit A [candidate division KSB1 bacterium]MDZ7273465.1 putative monovalent cation/H+ antiporter subunit A [candidate division KSB1 bacterium]MDZ7286943.1 putative monovalent cation/H+ antiporter subunit A [candidate division KSB1 bacterium]MDZ7299704.1 putative monovalent cation/H+ antiporter subunit A [candidate division KSB1 bacterium]MDZ7308698.1 putative monovalent cation/H+ antiporter subunit A [candidate division KSB1 bacterium]
MPPHLDQAPPAGSLAGQSQRTLWQHPATGWLLAILPAGALIYLLSLTGRVAAGESVILSLNWVPSLAVSFSFLLDGLSLLFAVLITGIGALILIYAGGYLAGHTLLGRFYFYLLLFMAAMLGVVLADNLITLFVFWELTSLSSYLLIGFDHHREEARKAALQALLVTGGGGLALLAGLLLLGNIGGSFELSELLQRGDLVRGHTLYLPLLLLVLAGAFAKSAQVPFHFWLPNAMAAPAPVSAYLHSATMVKAGVYLLARLSPILGGTEAWHYLVTLAGAATMLIGALLAFPQTDLKKILAYTTVSTLGGLTLLLGLNTTLAAKAAMVFLIVHCFYKGALFMIAGAVDHETATRDLRELSGLRRFMPLTTLAATLAALSMAGLPPMLGFISKELLYEAKLEAPRAAFWITSAGVLANVLLVAIAARLLLRPFFGRQTAMPQTPHEAPVTLWLGPVTLAILGLIIGLAPDTTAQYFIVGAVSAVRAEATEVKLALWHGINPVLALSVLTVASGLLLYSFRRLLQRATQPLSGLARLGPQQWYEWLLRGLNGLAQWQTRLLQSGYLRSYLLMIILTTIGLTGYALVSRAALPPLPSLPVAQSYEWLITAIMLAAAIAVVRAGSRLAAVAALGVIGFSIALLFVLYGAPDLAMTQFAIETLSVIIFVLVLYKLPRFAKFSRPGARLRDALVALAAGGMMTLLVLAVTAAPLCSRLTGFFAENSLPAANGRNIVNVILVDFRGLDTLGEITVLAVAAVGVYALLKLRLVKDKEG